MSNLGVLLELHDVDVLRGEIADPRSVARLRKFGFTFPVASQLDALRDALVAQLEPRWATHYLRLQGRYGRAVTVVRGRACQGCFITLPTRAAPSDGQPLTTCESCGRILFWR